MVMKEFSRADLDLLLTDIRSAVRLQVVQFPGAGPHRMNREEKPEHRRHEEKKK